jgi:hypothetical protein
MTYKSGETDHTLCIRVFSDRPDKPETTIVTDMELLPGDKRLLLTNRCSHHGRNWQKLGTGTIFWKWCLSPVSRPQFLHVLLTQSLRPTFFQ